MIDLTRDGAVATVTLNRPEKLNALSMEMRSDLVRVFEELRFDDAVRAIVLTGAGRGFCSGADVGRMGGRDLRGARSFLQASAHPLVTTIFDCEKPVLAAVRGPAVGIGWSLALACDLILASTTARFSQIYKRIGLAPDGGAIWFLSRRLGMGRGKDLVFSGRMVEAEEALALGLVEAVVPDDALLDAARIRAEELAQAPTFALGLAKALFHAAAGPSLRSFLEMEALVQPQLNQTDDHHEGVRAFKEKRPPNFSGR
ncbi:enoyl-CoA hydratase/isomerase family protein [Enterovirga rhinocerotis]|uniref:2-(1,2-epoxy-1,2-dihydrophenyl)acetyl-CoA isomerase n=1 Tax=Enterovirga rhinocerotis TaxID=1339210 RepID=A0A4R7C6Q8_9HYPH|nr:enoyl-CoA hydratase/isomerase family protein [Enterovirga rhinocerotis]TDR92925.1 2-(1,2-epoxy-1,2-dihydrophenyl)acetyl-CoA isomerase [Enterovirga rhinocerotis]